MSTPTNARDITAHSVRLAVSELSSVHVVEDDPGGGASSRRMIPAPDA